MLSVQKKQYEKPHMIIKLKPNKISSDLLDHKKNRHLAQTLCTTTLMCMMAMPTGAQEITGEASTDNVEVIEVSGLLGTMTRSLNEKKNTIAIAGVNYSRTSAKFNLGVKAKF